ncbi:MAG: RuBisCO large subunit C-terminal-like domain-containing protein [Candidatus Aenigmarchaeota archaeon]|nr:RuBisCO large subunit C-terminal-like domain-containing protein [Candidatus Aenigmarchaeota archaeon]MDI6722492.1 RuBisCO large subunit C-terminal-like domain-containing protein [Candidatus Aenigmarchaeota archaeon]
MAVQLNYTAPKGWKPNPEKYIIVLFKIELADGVPKSRFLDAAASVAAESSTGTWTEVYAGKHSGMGNAKKYRAMVFDVDKKRNMFKVAYPLDLFELGNISGFLAGPAGNIAGMKMLKGLRIMDMRFPKRFVLSFPGPRYGIGGLRKMLGHKGIFAEMPVIGTVPKPKIGRTDVEQALLARQLFLSGDGSYNFIKDDENLTSLKFSNFYRRTVLVLNEIKKAEKRTGHKKLYLANISHSSVDEMLRRSWCIKNNGGRAMMLDIVVTGFAALHTMRLKTGLFIHAHRAMHGFMTRESGSGIHGKGRLQGFSVSMLTLAKIYRLLGVDSLHIGSPKAKMEDYGEAAVIAEAITTNTTPQREGTLGQEWYGTKSVWPVASGGLHPGVLDKVVSVLGHDIIIQMGGGVLGHPDGISAGVEAALQARRAVAQGVSIEKFVKANPYSPLAKAVEKWGYGPKIVY